MPSSTSSNKSPISAPGVAQPQSPLAELVDRPEPPPVFTGGDDEEQQRLLVQSPQEVLISTPHSYSHMIRFNFCLDPIFSIGRLMITNLYLPKLFPRPSTSLSGMSSVRGFHFTA